MGLSRVYWRALGSDVDRFWSRVRDCSGFGRIYWRVDAAREDMRSQNDLSGLIDMIADAIAARVASVITAAPVERYHSRGPLPPGFEGKRKRFNVVAKDIAHAGGDAVKDGASWSVGAPAWREHRAKSLVRPRPVKAVASTDAQRADEMLANAGFRPTLKVAR